MTLTVTNLPSGASAIQSAISSPQQFHFEALSQSAALTGVVSGCGATAVGGGTPLRVAIAVGVARYTSRRIIVGATNLDVTADATNPRWGLISVPVGTGTVSAVLTMGTAETVPALPTIPATSVPLWGVYVTANATAVTVTNLQDLRITVPEIDVYNVKDYGAVDNAATDSSAAFTAVAAAAAADLKGQGNLQKIIIPPGRYLTGSITITAVIRWIGAGAQFTEVIHKPSLATPLFTLTGYDTPPNSIPFGGFIGMRLTGGSATTALLYYDGAPDQFVTFDDLQFRGDYSLGTSSPVTDGLSVGDYINLHIGRVRFDHLNGWGINVRNVTSYPGGMISVAQYTYDNQGGTTTGTINFGFGILKVDCTNYASGPKGVIRLGCGSIEVNQGILPATGAERSLIRLIQNTTYMANANVTPQLSLHIGEMVILGAPSGPTQRYNFKVVSTNVGDVLLNIDDARLSNITQFYENDIGTTKGRITTHPQSQTRVKVIAPHDRSVGYANRMMQYLWMGLNITVHETQGNLVDANSYFESGDISFRRTIPTSPTDRRVFAAQAISTAKGRAVSPGNTVSLGTGSITTGTAILTMSATITQSQFVPGQQINVVGAGTAGADLNAMVVAIDYTAGTNTVTLDTNAGTTVAGAAVSVAVTKLMYVPLVDWGSAAPSTGTYQINDRVWNTASSASTPTGWICITAGTPGTWVPIGPQQIPVTLGPFFLNDVPGTATTQAQLAMFNTAAAVSLTTNDIKMQKAGKVVGAMIVSDAARTAGSATVQVRIAGTATAFNAAGCALDATNTTSDSDFLTPGSGLAFTAGQTLGVAIVTSSWTPTTADVSVWLSVLLNAF